VAKVQDQLSESVAITDPAGTRQRLLVLNPPANRHTPNEGRPATSLAAVFDRFAETQHLVGEQVIALEDLVREQGEQLAEASAQLPDIKERINWLIATYYEDQQTSQSFRERLARQEAGLATLTEAVRGLCETQAQWRQTLEQMLVLLGRAHGTPIPSPPSWPGQCTS